MEVKKIAHDDNIDWLLDKLEDGDLDAILQAKSNDLVTKKILTIAKRLANYLYVLNGIAERDFTRNILNFSHTDKIGYSIVKTVSFVEKIIRLAHETEISLQAEKNNLLQEDWIKTQYAGILSKIKEAKNLSDLGDIILRQLAFSINAKIGTFFVKIEKDAKAEGSFKKINYEKEYKLKLLSTYGINPDLVQKEFVLGEGLIGQTLLNLEPMIINDVPDNFYHIHSGLGCVKPGSVVIMPITYEKESYGVLEIASFTPLSAIQYRLLQQVIDNVGISIKNITNNMLTENLFKKIATTNNSLVSQKQALDASAIVAETDIRGIITDVNAKFVEISKFRKEELLGQDHRILNSGFHSRDFFINLWQTISKGEVWHAEIKNKAKDGTYYWVDTTIYPVKDERGKLQKFVAIRFDITDKKRALEELQVANEKATKVARIKSEFLANMSHEIRTPMNSIIGMGELLKETKLNIEQEKYVNNICNAGNSLLDIINNILDISKIESGHIEIEEIPFDFEDVIFSVTELMGFSARKKNLEIVISIDPTINTKVVGDPSRLRQVIVNLLANAIKFTAHGEIEIKIEKIKKQPRWLYFAVRDTGIGIENDKIGKLFTKFSQANSTTTREYGGTGLGLAISKKIVELMGGSIGVKSVFGKGSTFYFFIPLEEQKIGTAPSFSYLRGKNCLIAEDNQTSRLFLKRILEAYEMQIAEAKDGKSAIEKISSENISGKKYDLVILDHKMPDLDGIELAKIISKDFPNSDIPIIMLTTEDKISLKLLKDTKIYSYIVKPIKKSILLEQIQNIFEGSKNIPKIVLVDDDPDMLKLMVTTLQELKIEILAATNVNMAIEYVKNNEIFLIVSDLNMPGDDGVALVREIRKLNLNIPIIFMSGYVSKYVDSSDLSYGDIEFIDKASGIESLHEMVSKRLFNFVPNENNKPKSIEHLKRKILFVDDVKENTDLLKLYLKEYPYEVDIAKNGQEAVEKFVQKKFDLIFMDIQMPIMDGYEATKTIRLIETETNLKRTPIISLSAHALSEYKQQSLSFGADGFLSKPIKKSSLLAIIEKHLKVKT